MRLIYGQGEEVFLPFKELTNVAPGGAKNALSITCASITRLLNIVRLHHARRQASSSLWWAVVPPATVLQARRHACVPTVPTCCLWARRALASPSFCGWGR